MYTKHEEINALFDLTDQVAVVTGGGSGIGQAIAMGYAAAGAKVVLVDFSQENMDETAKLFADSGYSVTLKKCDVGNAENVDQVFEEIVAELGPVDILVNSAGITQAKPSTEVTAEEFSKILQVNLVGLFNCCKAAAKSMLPREKGRIINIGSMRGLTGTAWGTLPYGTSKAGVNLLTRQLAVEWAKQGVNVNCLVPNLTITPISKYIMDNKPRYEFYLSRIPMGFPAYPKDFVAPAIFLASSGSSYITGQEIYVDGGTSIG